MDRLTTIASVRAAVAGHRAAGRRVGFVPTMGALHAGHLSLVEHARTLADAVVVSIFVNPTQFGPGEDLEAYPRDIEADEAALRSLGAAAPDHVFAPAVAEVYPRPGVTTVHVAGMTDVLCGASRPGHFDGVTTVVTKLLNMVGPDVAVFGRKDFQQLATIRRMVADLNVGVEIVGAPTVREPDGLAMSSRNAYLGPEERLAARTLSRALRTAVETARGQRDAGRGPDPDVIRAAAADTLGAHPGVRIDYVDVLDADTLTPPDATRGQATAAGDAEPVEHMSGELPPRTARLLVAVAAHVGRARLIDNVVIGDLADEDRLIAATA